MTWQNRGPPGPAVPGAVDAGGPDTGRARAGTAKPAVTKLRSGVPDR